MTQFLQELTTDELQEVAASAGLQRFSFSRKGELIESILNTRESSHIAGIAERVETLSGFKHIWIFTLAANPWLGDAARFAEVLWPEAPGTHFDLDETKDELQPTLQFIDPWSNSVYLKFTHWVESDTWEPVRPDLKALKRSRTRHPLVAVFHADTSIVEFRFGGYTQGLATPKHQRLPYDELVSRAARLIESKLGYEVQGLQIQDALSELLQLRHQEVVDVRRVVRPSFGGRLVLDAADAGTDMDVTVLMSRFFANVVRRNEKQLASSVREALIKTPVDNMLLAWTELGIMTRIAFYEIGPELLFIWRGERRTLQTIDYVVSAIVERMRFRSGGAREALRAVSASAPGDIIRATDLASRFQLTARAAYVVLEDARRGNLVERRFRIRTHKVLQEVSNVWRTSLSAIPDIVTTEDGEEIDVLDPRNIEIGFQRIGDENVH